MVTVAKRGAAPRRVTMIGPFPPPVNGAAKNTALIAQALEQRGIEVERLNTAVGTHAAHVKSLAYHASRLRRTLSNAARLQSGLGRTDSVYLVTDGGLGIWYNLLYGAILRLGFRGGIFLHHRNYSHIGKRNPAMARLLSWLGGKATHIFLEDRMGAAFETTYGVTLDRFTVRNAATCDVRPVEPADRPDDGPPTISFLSNLTDEKGFHIVEAVFLALGKSHPEWRFSIAGPAATGIARERLGRLQAELGDRLSWPGPVAGEDKQRFFAGCDVFFFPTVYRLEAQPNVLYEAMAAGCAIVSTRHACIPDMLGDAPNRLVDIGPDMAAASVSAIEEMVRARMTGGQQGRAVAAFTALRAEAEVAYAGMLNRMAGGADAR